MNLIDFITAPGILIFLQNALPLDELYRGLMVAVILGGLGLVCYRFRDEGQRTKSFLITALFDVLGSTSVTLGLSPFIFDILQEKGWKINFAAVVFFGFIAMLFGWQIRPVILAFAKLRGLQTDLLKTVEELKEEKKKITTLAPDKPNDEEDGKLD